MGGYTRWKRKGSIWNKEQRTKRKKERGHLDKLDDQRR